MNIALGADEHLHIVDTVLQYVKDANHNVSSYLPSTGETLPWQQVAEQVAEGKANEGILLCWTGTGVSIAANKVRGVRAALCNDAETARGARLWNDANVLCLSMRSTSDEISKEILTAWFETSYKPNESDDACLAQIIALDEAR